MNAKPAACLQCPAYHYGIGFVPPTTAPRTCRFVVVGQGPGEWEAQFGIPFYPRAPTGQMMRGWLVEAGIDLRDVAFGNVVQCWLPKVKKDGNLGRQSRVPTSDEAEFCYQAHLLPWLRPLVEGGAHVLAAGVPATQVFLGWSAGTTLAGVTHHIELTEHSYGSPF